jgi:hypothetical protein
MIRALARIRNYSTARESAAADISELEDFLERLAEQARDLEREWEAGAARPESGVPSNG